MPEGKGPRPVWTLNELGRIGFGVIYSDGTSQGPELVAMEVDAQTNQVSWDKKPGVYGKNFVEIGEDTSHVGDDEREAFTHAPGGGEVTQAVDEGPSFGQPGAGNAPAPRVGDVRDIDGDGEVSEEERKQAKRDRRNK